MQLLDRLQKNIFIATIKDLLTFQKQLKILQLTGSDSIKMKRIFSNNQYDVQFTNIRFANTTFRLTFTPDFPNTVVYKMAYKFDYNTSSSQSSVQMDQFNVEREKIDTQTGQQTWLFAPMGSDYTPNDFLRIKFYFWASGTGKFTINVL